ncbi:GGDEF domain-containing protein [Tamilnaduibacter salinus]|uniref:diguanylate cyclase n=1 Tax=Tamilnaduibacter salinus TaxID=1484056 RepID=A0A2A2I5Q2_9GAMM|nr:GGDEF domain-containing protein [Tamilnaduibacter salinus]PAV27059.1 GGDEF domain-containing protein [Tamilnaduibacter salinus]
MVNQSGRGVLTANPTETVSGYQRRIVFHIHFWALIAVAPLIPIQWAQDHALLSLLLGVFCLGMVLVLLFLRLRDYYLFNGWLFAVFAIASVLYSTLINGYIGLFWAYPAIAAIFFLMALRRAIGINAVFVVAVATVSYYRFPEAEFWRITFSLALSVVFVTIFAWLVGRMQAELTKLATTDPLTGCLNRSQLADVLNRHIQLRERYERVASLVLIDLDHFKSINDRWGHTTGDRVLQEAARRLDRRLRECDQLFRVGGEEFMVILPETRQKTAEDLARELLITLSSAPFLEDVPITASAGVTEVVRGETWSTWLNRADQALYTAKHTGRGRVIGVRGQDAAMPAAGDTRIAG